MPLYKYSAKDLKSAVIRGEQEADGEEELARLLRGSGLFLTDCTELAPRESTVYKIKANELADFCSELGAMLASGITLIRAMAIVLDSDLKPKMRKLYQGVYSGLQRGMSFSEALEAQNGSFPPLMVNIFRSGEASGTMDQAAKKAASHFEKDHRIRSKVKSAMTYPIILVVLGILIMIGVFVFILPQFFESFKEMDMELPVLTIMLMSFSDLLTQHWMECLVVVIGVLLVVSLILQHAKVQLALDRFKLRIPKVGKLMQVIYTARFARTLSTLYVSGLSMLQALGVASQTIGNKFITQQFDEVLAQIRGGAQLSQALKKVNGFAPKLASITLIGEESGRLDEMLDTMADSFDFESEKAIDRLVTLLEPVMIVILAVGVAIVMLATMMPLYNMYQNMG